MYQNKADTTFAGIKDVHYGHLAHQTIAWSVGFASLELLINYCDDEYNSRTALKNNNTTENDNGNGNGNGNNMITKDDMRKNKLFLPPPLTRDFLLENATAEFDAAVDVAYQSYVDNDCTSSNSSSIIEEDQNPCFVSWISTPGNFDNRAINQFMNKHKTAIPTDGWEAERQNGEGWSNKDGWIATKANASFTMEFKNIEKNVKTVTFYFLRSYGDKWKDSRAKFTISRPNENTDDSGKNATTADDSKEEVTTILSEEEIAGVHAAEDYKYSLTLSQTMRLSDVVLKGETLNIKIDLISGSHFKIMGMMLCNK